MKVRKMSSWYQKIRSGKTTIILSTANWLIPLLSLKFTHRVGQNYSGKTVDPVMEMYTLQRAGESFKT